MIGLHGAMLCDLTDSHNSDIDIHVDNDIDQNKSTNGHNNDNNNGDRDGHGNGNRDTRPWPVAGGPASSAASGIRTDDRTCGAPR